jgi:hypothetical protein
MLKAALFTASALALARPAFAQITVVHSLDGATEGGGSFVSTLVPNATGQIIYGLGSNTAFQIGPTGVYSDLFALPEGESPYGSPVAYRPGHLFWATSDSGAHKAGEVLMASLATGKISRLHTFGKAQGLSEPVGIYAGPGQNLFGFARQGGANGSGGIYELDATTLQYSQVLSFPANFDGNYNNPGVLDGSGVFWGTARVASGYDFWSFNTITGEFNPDVASVTGTDNGTDQAITAESADGDLYGVARFGLNQQCGGIWQFSPATGVYRVLKAFITVCEVPSAPTVDPAGNLYFGLLKSGIAGLSESYFAELSGSDASLTTLATFDGPPGPAGNTGTPVIARGVVYDVSAFGGTDTTDCPAKPFIPGGCGTIWTYPTAP